MKTQKGIKLIFIITIAFLMTFMNFSSANAFSTGDIITEGTEFIKDGEKDFKISKDVLQDLSGNVYNIVFVIAVVIATIVGVILAIQFIMGSVEQKSKIKESLIPYGIGCIVIFGAFGIWKIVVTILSAVD